MKSVTWKNKIKCRLLVCALMFQRLIQDLPLPLPFSPSISPSELSDWFQLDAAIRNSQSIAIFKSRLLSFICPIQSDLYNIFDPIGLKFLTSLRLEFSHLNERGFRHNFQDCLNPLCSCSLQTEDTIHYLLHFSQHRVDLINSVKYIFEDFDSLPDNAKKDLLLYGHPRFDINKNKFILEATILTYLINS